MTEGSTGQQADIGRRDEPFRRSLSCLAGRVRCDERRLAGRVHPSSPTVANYPYPTQPNLAI